MATTRIMPLHTGKGRSVARVLRDVKDYMENPLKTEGGELISSFECAPETADAEFLLSKSRYLALTGRNQGKRDVLAYHIRQSFKPGEITPEAANAIGYELAMRFTKGRHAFIVCTHTDKAHIHNHVVWNSTALDCERKFRNFIGSAFALRRCSDILCAEHGLSIIENPKPSPGRDYARHMFPVGRPPSHQDELRIAIDAALGKRPASFGDFLSLMQAAGYRWLYILGKLPKPRPPRHPILWEEVRKLRRFSEQIRLLCRYKIDTSEQLQAFSDSTKSRMDDLIRQRTKVQNKLRRAKDPEIIVALKAEKTALTEHIAPLRKNLKLAAGIAENTARMKEKMALVRQLELQEKQKTKIKTKKKEYTR